MGRQVNYIDSSVTGSADTNGTSGPCESKRPYYVLFLSDENSPCSVFAEAILHRLGGEDFCALSARIRPESEIDPFGVEVLKKNGLWHQHLNSRDFSWFLTPHAPRMDFIISIGDPAPVRPWAVLPGSPEHMHWQITEPLQNETVEQAAKTYRKILVELENRLKLFVLVYRKEILQRRKASYKRTASAA